MLVDGTLFTLFHILITIAYSCCLVRVYYYYIIDLLVLRLHTQSSDFLLAKPGPDWLSMKEI